MTREAQNPHDSSAGTRKDKTCKECRKQVAFHDMESSRCHNQSAAALLSQPGFNMKLLGDGKDVFTEDGSNGPLTFRALTFRASTETPA